MAVRLATLATEIQALSFNSVPAELLLDSIDICFISDCKGVVHLILLLSFIIIGGEP
jgi:hypothetical protein